MQADEVQPRAVAAGQAKGALEIAVAEGHELGIVGADLKDRLHAQAAAPLPGAGRIGQQLVADQPVRRLLLEHLVVLIEHAAGGVDHADVVVAVAARQRTRAALQAHETDIDVLLAGFRVDASGE